MIAFAGEPRQRVARIAGTPMTNLHLGNRREDPATLLDAETMRRVEDAVRSGCLHIVLTDANIDENRAALPMILAAGAVHSYLVRQSLRTFTSLNGFLVVL